MANWRVVRKWSWMAEAYIYRFEDVESKAGRHPFVKHCSMDGTEGPLICCTSVEELQTRLRELLEATKQPVLQMTTPQLEEVKR